MAAAAAAAGAAVGSQAEGPGEAMGCQVTPAQLHQAEKASVEAEKQHMGNDDSTCKPDFAQMLLAAVHEVSALAASHMWLVHYSC